MILESFIGNAFCCSINRDINPNNILLIESDIDKIVKIIDFTTAKKVTIPELKAQTTPSRKDKLDLFIFDDSLS
jgi:serine/threonine protein kinase